jgi:hypothetical protein
MAAGLVSKDVDKDGNKDIIVTGNCYPMRVQIGPLDAGIGIVLKGNGKGDFRPVGYDQTNLYVAGDVRSMIEVKTNNSDLLMTAKSNSEVQVITVK